MVTICPRLLGGRTAPTLVDGTGFKCIAKSAKLVLERAVRHGDEMVLCSFKALSYIVTIRYLYDGH